jgi:hypothetical protein
MGAMSIPHQRQGERRADLRFEALTVVRIESGEHGHFSCIARNVSRGGMFLELGEPLPLASQVQVFFSAPDGAEIALLATVRNHYYLNYGPEGSPRQVRGMGLRFNRTAEQIEAQPFLNRASQYH